MMFSDVHNKEFYSLKDIENIMKNKYKIREVASGSNIEVLDLLIDAERVIQLANPTDKQLLAVKYIWELGYTLDDAGKELGVSAQAIKYNLDLLKKKIKVVLNNLQ